MKSSNKTSQPKLFSKKNKYLIIIGSSCILAILILTSVPYRALYETTYELTGGIPLIPPPIDFLSAFGTAPALDTGDMAFTSYIDLDEVFAEQINDYDIYDTVGLLLYYSDHYNAIDGKMRIYDLGEYYDCVLMNPDTQNCYKDVYVRIRSDYKIIVWLDDDELGSTYERGPSYIWWNHSVGCCSWTRSCSLVTSCSYFGYGYGDNDGLPIEHGLVTNYAIYRLLIDGMNITIGSFPDQEPLIDIFDWADIKVFDFENDDSRRLFVIGSSQGLASGGTLDHYFHFKVDVDSTIDYQVFVYGQTLYYGEANITWNIDPDGTYWFQLSTWHQTASGQTIKSRGWYGIDIVPLDEGDLATLWRHIWSSGGSSCTHTFWAMLIWTH